MSENQNIYVTKPSMPDYEKYIERIKKLWDSKILTNMGMYHSQLEKELEKYLGVREISLLSNGHMALEMMIQAMDFEEGAEVITTPFTFVSTVHAIVRNHLKPVFCDIKIEDGTIDEEKIEELITDKTVAIVPVHVFGNACAVEKINSVAKKYNLKVLYDAAHAFGVEYNNKGIGSYGDASIFSFHATKVFNTIEGGAVVCKEHSLYEKLYFLKNFGIRDEELVPEIGANAKLNEFQAVMGLCNLENITEEIDKRKKVTELYDREIAKIKGIHTLLNINPNVKRNYAYYPIYIDCKVYGMSRDELYNRMKEKGIHPRKYFYPMVPNQLCYKNKYDTCKLKNAERLSENTLLLPLYADLSEMDVKRIISCLIK